MPRKIEISHRTIVFTVLFLIILWFLYQIRSLLVILFVGLILMSALKLIVEKLEKLRIPRVLAILLVYLLIFTILGVLLAVVIPPLINQTSTLISRIPQYLEYLRIRNLSQDILQSQLNQLGSRLGSVSADILRITRGIFGNLLGLLTLILVSFYLLLERQNLGRYILKLFGSNNDKKIGVVIEKIEKRLGQWVRAEITLMLIVGTLTYIGLRLLGIEYALSLALMAGILEIIPNIGPLISAVPAVLMGLTISPLMALAVAALYFLVQQLENNLIVPQIMAKETGVNPLVAILSLIAGFQIAGGLGAVLAIPFVLMIEVILSEILSTRRNSNT